MVKIAGFVLGLAIAAGSSASAQDSNYEANIRMGINLDIANSNCKISNLPLSVRSVPAHPDDHTTAPPINDKEARCSFARVGVRTEIGARRRTNDGELLVGTKITLPFWSDNTLGELIRSNYTNHIGTETRGEGAALTFLGPINKLSLSDLRVGFFLQSSKSLSEEVFHSFWRVDVEASKLNVLTGWDRYSHLDLRKTYSLGTLITPTASYGWEIRDDMATLKFYGKVSYDLLLRSNLASETKIKRYPTIGVGIDALFGK